MQYSISSVEDDSRCLLNTIFVKLVNTSGNGIKKVLCAFKTSRITPCVLHFHRLLRSSTCSTSIVKIPDHSASCNFKNLYLLRYIINGRILVSVNRPASNDTVLTQSTKYLPVIFVSTVNLCRIIEMTLVHPKIKFKSTFYILCEMEVPVPTQLSAVKKHINSIFKIFPHSFT